MFLRVAALLFCSLAVLSVPSQGGQEQCSGAFPAFDGAPNDRGRMGYIDSAGRVVIDFSFYSAQPFSEGLACVTITRDGKQGYIDKTGKIAIEPKFDWAFPFKEARAKIQINGKWGYVDPIGKVIVEPKLEDADNFYEGLAAVKLFGKWGYIDTNGKPVIPPVFDRANRFSEGFACVLKNGQLGYIDKSGKWVITPRLERLPSLTDELQVTNFKEGLAVAKRGKQYGYFTVTIGLLVRNEDRDQPIIVLSKFAQSLAQAGQPTPPTV